MLIEHSKLSTMFTLSTNINENRVLPSHLSTVQKIQLFPHR